MAGFSVLCLGCTQSQSAVRPRADAQADVGAARPTTPAREPVALRPVRPPGGISAGYHNYDAMSAALHELVDAAGGRAKLTSIAKSHHGRDIWVLELATAGDVPAEKRQGILIVGGVDADHPAGSETALNLARALVKALAEHPDGDAAKMLAERVLYIVPRLNPDGVEQFFNTIRHAGRLASRPIDADRDGAADEDGPNDLNGDGQISVMRVRDGDGKWMIDPDEPRLMRKADPTKNERGVFKLMLEGIDDDSDGAINEDPPGGVDHDRNWPHLFESGTLEAGIHQLSEPENRAFVDFIDAHLNITAAMVYGRHDNIVKVPKGKDRGPAGQAYKDLHPDDVKFYEFISKKYKEITGLEGSGGSKPAGAFYSWLYAQRGVTTFATSLWWPAVQEKKKPTTQPSEKDAEKKDEPEDEPEEASHAPGDEPAGGGASRSMTLEEMLGARHPAVAVTRIVQRGTVRQTGRRPGGRGRTGQAAPAPGGAAKASADPLAARVESTKTIKSWLKYSDDKRDGEGFVKWSEYDHPTLGKVEIGGMAPYFDTTPPATELDAIAEKQIEFLVELSGLLPSPGFGKARVSEAGAGLWQVELRMVNTGYLPTHTGIARHIRLPGWAVRPRVEPDRLVGGQRMERIANLAGSGGSATLRWLIRGNEGDSVEFTAFNRVFGELETTVTLRATGPGEENE